MYENFSAPTKATSGRPPYSPALYQIKSAIAKLLVSLRCQHCQVKIREGQAEETAWYYGCNRWWWLTCRGAGVEYLIYLIFSLLNISSCLVLSLLVTPSIFNRHATSNTQVSVFASLFLLMSTSLHYTAGRSIPAPHTCASV